MAYLYAAILLIAFGSWNAANAQTWVQIVGAAIPVMAGVALMVVMGWTMKPNNITMKLGNE